MDLRLKIEKLCEDMEKRADALSQFANQPVNSSMRDKAIGEIDGINYVMLHMQEVLQDEGVVETFTTIPYSQVRNLHQLADSMASDGLNEEADNLRSLIPDPEERGTCRVSLQDAIRGLRQEQFLRARPETAEGWAVWRRDRLETEYPCNLAYAIDAEDVDNAWIAEYTLTEADLDLDLDVELEDEEWDETPEEEDWHDRRPEHATD